MTRRILLITMVLLAAGCQITTIRPGTPDEAFIVDAMARPGGGHVVDFLCGEYESGFGPGIGVYDDDGALTAELPCEPSRKATVAGDGTVLVVEQPLEGDEARLVAWDPEADTTTELWSDDGASTSVIDVEVGGDGGTYLTLATWLPAFSGTLVEVVGPDADDLRVVPGVAPYTRWELEVLADGSVIAAAEGEIVRIDTTGTVTRLAGTGTVGSTGDGGPAIEAQVGRPILDVAPDGRIVFSETLSGRVRSFLPGGTIETIAGGADEPGGPDGGLATQAYLQSPGPVDAYAPGCVLLVEQKGFDDEETPAGDAIRHLGPRSCALHPG